MNSTYDEQDASPKSSGWKVLVASVAAIGLFTCNVYLLQKVSSLNEDMTQWRKSMQAEVAELRETQSAGLSTQGRRLESLAEQAEKQIAATVSHSQGEAKKTAAQLARLSAEQQKQQQQLVSELTQVKEVASSANTRLADVSTEITTVKSDVASTRSDLEKTVADLKRVNGDMGVVSGLIATNSKELAALRELGERNYFEFNLTKTKTPQKVGTITMILKKTDPKRSKYTVEIYADDKRVEKKDKTANEPVQFYVSQSRQPYEIVVNEVKSGRLIGYLATPKLQFARK